MLALNFAVVPLVVPLALSLGSEFMPPLSEGTVLYMPTSLPGLSPAKGAEVLQLSDRMIRTVPEVKTVISKAGRPEDGTDPKLINMAEFLVDLKPESEWKRGIDKPKLLREIEAERVAAPSMDSENSKAPESGPGVKLTVTA